MRVRQTRRDSPKHIPLMTEEAEEHTADRRIEDLSN